MLVSSNWGAVYVGRNFAPLHTVRWGVLVSCCLLSGWPASSVQSHCCIQNCAAHLVLKRCKTDHITPLVSISPLASNPTKNSVQDKHSAINASWALLCLISVTVFNFTRPPVLSAPLLILSASRFLAPDSPLFVPAPFLFSVHQHGMTFPFLSDRNPLWTHSSLT